MLKKLSGLKIKEYLLAFFIPVILITVFCALKKIPPFGGYDIFLYSGTEELKEFLYEFWISARQGRFFYFSTRSGVGYDFSTVITYYFANPLVFIYLLLPKSSLSTFSSILFIFEAGLAGLFSYLMFSITYTTNVASGNDSSEKTSRDINKAIYIILSTLYSVSFIIPNSRINSVNAISVALLPLVILGLRKLLQKGKSFLYIITLAIATICSIQIAIPIFIFMCFYMLVLSFRDFKLFIRMLIPKLISDLIAIGLAMPFVLNNISSSFFHKEYSLSIKQFLFTNDRYKMFSFILVFLFIYLVSFLLNSKHCEKKTDTKKKNNKKFILIGVSVLAVAAVFLVSIFSKDRFNKLDIKVLSTDIVLKSSEYDYYDNVKSYGTPVTERLIDIYAPTAYVVPSSVLKSRLRTEYPYEKMNSLVKEMTGIEDIFVFAEDNLSIIPDPTDPTNGDKMIVYLSFNQEGDYYTSLDGVYELGKLYPEERYEIKCVCPNNKLKRILNGRESAYLDRDKYDEFDNKLNDIKVDITRDYYSLRIESIGDELKAKDDSILLIPNDLSRCFVPKGDAERIQSFKFFEDEVSYIENFKEGDEYKYSPVAFLHGTVVSLIALLMFVGLFVFERRKKVEKNDKNIDDDEKANKLSDSIVDWLSERRVYYFSIIINLLLYLIVVIAYNMVPFGEDSFVRSDGYLISYPGLVKEIWDLRDGTMPVLDFTLGMGSGGTTFLSSLATFVFPYRLILLLSNLNNSLVLYNLVYLLEFLTVGPAIIFYLIHRPNAKNMEKTALKLVPISMAYSLSSYILVYYHFCEFMVYATVLPIMLLVMERLVYLNKKIVYIILLALCMFVNPYYAFIMCELLLLYFFTLDFEDGKDFLRKGVRFALCSIAAAGVSLFKLIPYYQTVMNTGYNEADGNASNTLKIFTQSLLKNINDIDIKYPVILVTSDWTQANAYVGLLPFLIIPVYMAISGIPLKKRIKRVALIFIIYFAFGNQLLNFALHGFHFQNLVPNRFSIFYIFLVVTLFYDVIINYKEIYKTKAVIAFASMAGITLLILIINNNFETNKLILSALFIIAYLVTIFYGNREGNKYKCTRALLFVLMIELVVSGVHTIGANDDTSFISPSGVLVMRDYSEKYDLKSDPLLRSEVLNTDNFNTAKMVNTNSVSVFTSTFQQEQAKVSRTYNVETQNNNINYVVGNPLANLFLNVHYFLAEGSGDVSKVPYYYERVEKSENIYLYRDPYAASAGIILPKDAGETYGGKLYGEQGGKITAIEAQNELCQALVGKDLYTIIDLDYNTAPLNEYSFTQLDATIADDIKGDIYVATNREVKYAGYSKGKGSFIYAQIEIPNGFNKEDIKVAVLDESALALLSEYVKNHSLSDYSLEDDTLVGHYDSKEAGELMIPVPAYKEWTVYIDGVETTYNDSMGGVTLDIPAGKHEIKMSWE